MRDDLRGVGSLSVRAIAHRQSRNLFTTGKLLAQFVPQTRLRNSHDLFTNPLRNPLLVDIFCGTSTSSTFTLQSAVVSRCAFSGNDLHNFFHGL